MGYNKTLIAKEEIHAVASTAQQSMSKVSNSCSVFICAADLQLSHIAWGVDITNPKML